MGLRQLHTAETMFIDDGLTDGAVFPPSSNAVYDALQNAIELPSVTAEDDGDVLTVVSGAWAKATPSGGGGGLGIEAVAENDSLTLNKTAGEIYDAISSGQFAHIFMNTSGNISIFQIATITEYEDGGYVIEAYDSLGNTYTFYADSGTDYPSTDEDGGGGGTA